MFDMIYAYNYQTVYNSTNKCFGMKWTELETHFLYSWEEVKLDFQLQPWFHWIYNAERKKNKTAAHRWNKTPSNGNDIFFNLYFQPRLAHNFPKIDIKRKNFQHILRWKPKGKKNRGRINVEFMLG